MSDRTAQFQQHRPLLQGIAYRMLGSRADADDMVQEAYLRWHRADLERVQTPKAWLIATTTRLCIDRLRKAQVEREAYIGPWLPEPVVGDAAPGADAASELASDLSVAFLVMLERLAPEERAAFLLRDVFNTDYPDIGRILARNEASCRQVVHRARERLRRDKPRFVVNEAVRVRLLEQFVAALRAEDPAKLLSLFATDATWTSDGGGRTKAARKVVHGARHVTRLALGVWRAILSRATYRLMTINGESGWMTFVDGRPFAAITIDTDGTHILAVFVVLNPDKLARLGSAALPDLSNGLAL
jgi:RNA polymerase sigma-70 factor (ECF subfamily)